MDKAVPSQEHSSTYAADPPRGVSFLTEPRAADAAIVGYVKMGVWVSSTSRDMAIGAAMGY